MNILVTGAAGFIGSHWFNKLCNNKHTVVGIDSFTGDLSLKDIKESRVDNFLSKSGLFKKCDIFDEYLNDGHIVTDFIAVIVEIYKVSGLIKNSEENTEKN